MNFLQEFLKQLSAIIKSIQTIPEDELRNFLQKDSNRLLQRAILAGEYYNESCEKQLSDIESEFSNLESLFNIGIAKGIQDGTSPNWTLDRIKESKKIIEVITRKCFGQFRELQKIVSDNLNNYLQGQPRSDFNKTRPKDFEAIEQLSERPTSAFAPVEDPEAISDFILFRCNILIAYLDESMECNDDISNGLASINKVLEKIETNAYQGIIDVLKHKVDFLIFKIKYRDKHPKGDKTDNGTEFAKIEITNVFHPFYLQAKNHYSDENCNLKKAEIKALKDSIKRSVSLPPQHIKDFKLEDFHHLNRYYRKQESKLETAKKEISDLIDSLQDFMQKPLSMQPDKSYFLKLDRYHQVAFKTSLNSLIKTSLILDFKIQKKFDYRDLKEDVKKFIKNNNYSDVNFLSERFQQIKTISVAEDDINDFYGLVMFMEFLNDMLSYFKSNPQTVIEFDKDEEIKYEISDKKKSIIKIIDYIIKMYNEALDALNRGFQVLYSHKSFPVYLCQKESFVDYSVDGSKLFLRSSYILPNNFKKIEYRIKTWEIFFKMQETAVKDTFEIGISQAEIKKGFSDFDKKVKENEFKVVQIVAMFVSIATFVLINVKIFDNRTGLESFAIMGGLAACFILFNLFFYFIIIAQHRDRKKYVQLFYKLILFCLVLAIVVYGCYSILKTEEFKTSKEVKELREKVHKLDSVQKILENQRR